MPDQTDPIPGSEGTSSHVTANANDPVLALIIESTQALVAMSGTLDSHTKALDKHGEVLGQVGGLLGRLAKAEEEANKVNAGRWADIRAAAGVLWSNFMFSSAMTLALSMLALGLTLWVLTLLGVDVGQVAQWLPIGDVGSGTTPREVTP